MTEISTSFDFGAALRKSPTAKLGKRAAKLGYRYVTRWPVPKIGTDHILEHQNGERHFRSIEEVDRFIGEQEIANLRRGRA